ncbi:hypothetical protein C8K15_110147 [Paenisporosarcina sp. OV554]|nr:hypothetical protein C8K15_110147 [Paenisporosarcina sp. OV554]
MIKKDKVQNYQYVFLIKIDQYPILFKNSKEFDEDLVFSRHFSQRIIGDVNG